MISFKHILLIIILTTTQKIVFAQTNNQDSLNIIIKEIEEGSITAPWIGMGGDSSDYYFKDLKFLKERTNESTLLNLINHNSPSVRCSVIQALFFKKSSNSFNLLLNALYDSSLIGYLLNDGGFSCFFGDLIIDIFTSYHQIKAKGKKDKFQLTKHQEGIIDSILLFDKSIKIDSRGAAMKYYKKTDAAYQRLKEIFTDSSTEYVSRYNSRALIAIAKYRKLEDSSLIINNFKKGTVKHIALKAIEQFPNKVFYPYVYNYLDSNINKQILFDGRDFLISLNTISSYPNTRTLNLFNQIIKKDIDTKDGKYWCSHLLYAIKKHPNKLYESLLKRLVNDTEVMKNYLGYKSDMDLFSN